MRAATRFASLALAFAALGASRPVSAQQVAATAAASPSATAEAATFYADVLPILHENCVSCHQPAGLNMGGNVAPFSLLTYADARRRARRIAVAVREDRMPPWHAADYQHGMFKGERYLTDAEKATIIGWAEGGTPEGDPAAAPPEPDFLTASLANESGWYLGEPDLIIEFDEPFCIDDDVRDLYVNVRAQLTADMLPEARWIQSVEYRPGPAVHHILGGVGGLVPGSAPRVYEEGYSRQFSAGPREIVFRMHFNKEPGPGTAVCSNTQVGVTFKEPGEVIRFVTGGADLRIPDIMIPAGNESYSASREYVFEEDVEILSFLPHMHLRGTAALYEITYPDGKHEVLLHVPRYDFNWQNSYAFREPVFAPAGSTLRFTLWWDNSEDNPHNPDPTADVTWGLPTHAEMSQGYMSFRRLEERFIVVPEPGGN